MTRPRLLRPRPGLSARLLAAQVLVALLGVLTAWLVALLVGPALFHEHLLRAAASGIGDQTAHAEQAFASATAISLSVALLVALLAAVAASWYATRRISRPVSMAAQAATDIASGHYEARVEPPGLGPEFEALADSFNLMASRLSSIESTRRRLLSDLAHEMRTPLATIDAYLEGIEDGVASADTPTLAILREQTQRLSRLAQDVGQVSRAEERQLPLARQTLEPAALITEAAQAASARFHGQGVDLVSVAEADLPPISADPDRLNQVFANLLDNALRLTPAGGRVSLVARPAQGGVEFEVSDTGAGIASEHLDHVFERFYRVDTARDRAHGGSGIGLAISKALVQAHGGRISARSAGPGQGATFAVWLPRA